MRSFAENTPLEEGDEGVKIILDSLGSFRALSLIFSFPTMSLPASKLHLGYFNLLYPLSSSLEPHSEHPLDVPWDPLIDSGAPRFIAYQSIHLPSLE